MKWMLVFLLASLSSVALGSDISLPGISIDIQGEQQEEYTNAIKVLALLTVLSLAPAMLMMLTSFTRIIIVLAMLRHAIGMPTTPPNTVLVTLALFLTLFTMTPMIERLNANVLQPYENQLISDTKAIDRTTLQIKEFLISQTREKDIGLILKLADKPIPNAIDEVELSTLMPAFMLSELQTAFQIGFIIFLPFLVVDLIVASVLMSMGMIMLPPMTISLPIKILMFVLIEGWALVTEALVGSFS